MKRASYFFFALFILGNFTFSQEVKRIIVLPFDTIGNAEPYALGLAVGLERSLNVIDNIYVPPVGDAYLVTQRLQAEESLDSGPMLAAYNADVIVSGRITPKDGNAEVQLGFVGPNYPDKEDVFLSGAMDNPKQLLSVVANTVVSQLEIALSESDKAEFDKVLLQTPSLPSLQVVALSSSRIIPPSNVQLEAAASLDSSSSWVLIEKARGLTLSNSPKESLNIAQLATQYVPEDIEALLVYAILLEANDDISAAIDAYDKALSLNPIHPEALLGRASFTDDIEAAEQDLQMAISVNPRLEAAYFELARLQGKQQDPRSVQTLRDGAQKLPSSIQLHSAFVREASRLGYSAEAVSYLHELLASRSSPDLYRLVVSLPLEAFDDALNIIREGQQSYPQSVQPLIAEAELYERKNDLTSAIIALERAYALSPNDLEVVNQLAIAYAGSGRIDEAKQVIENSSPNLQSNTLQINLGQIYLEAGQNEAAVETLEPLLPTLSEDVDFLTVYGVALSRVGRTDQAINVLDKALTLDPNSNQAGELRQGLASGDVFTSPVTPTNSPVSADVTPLTDEQRSLFDSGLQAYQAGDFNTAISNFSEARALEDNVLLAFYHAVALQANGEEQRAIEGYERALQDLPNDDIILSNLGFAYYRISRYDKALDYLQRAINTNAENADAQLNLGLVNYTLGRYEHVVAPLEKAFQLEPDLFNLQVSNTNTSLTLGQILEESRQKANQ